MAKLLKLSILFVYILRHIYFHTKCISVTYITLLFFLKEGIHFHRNQHHATNAIVDSTRYHDKT